MKKAWMILLVIIASLNVSLAAMNHSDLGLTVKYKFGKIENKNCEKIEVADGYPIPHASCDFPDSIEETSTIKAELASNFGVIYLIEGLKKDACYSATHYLKHPMMTLPDGQKRTEYKRHFKIGSCMNDEYRYLSFFSWTLEEPWEVEAGEWIFEIRVDGKVLIKQEFLLEGAEPAQ